MAMSLLRRPVPSGFRVQEILIPPLVRRAYHEREWRDSLVVVERGSIELETMSGARLRLGSGAILYLMGLPLRELHNRGSVPAVLAVISRRARPNSFPGLGV